MIQLDSVTVNKLTPKVELTPFDCGDDDLNNFLHNDARSYFKELLAVTYLVQSQDTLVAYFCLLMDKIVFDFAGKDDPIRKWWKKFNKLNKIHFNKQRKTYPAVKLGRLGVSVDAKGCGIGRYILEVIVSMIVNTQNFGCRFVTVDAYREAFGFYQKLGFDFLSDEDVDQDTRQMYLDLTQFIEEQ
jgi:predicted GNAT family N-acyltransferase